MSTAIERLTDAAKAELDALYAKHGCWNLEDVVSIGLDPTSALSQYFTADRDKAAYKQHLREAREVLRLYRVEVKTTTMTLVAPLAVRDVDSKITRYLTFGAIRQDPEHARRTLEAEFARILQALERARALALVLDLSDEFEQAEELIRRMQERLVDA